MNPKNLAIIILTGTTIFFYLYTLKLIYDYNLIVGEGK